MTWHDLLRVFSTDLTQIAAIAGALVGIVSLVVGFIRSTRARRWTAASTEQLTRVEHRWNGRLDELLAVTRDLAYQRGVADGVRQAWEPRLSLYEGLPPAAEE